MEESLDSERGNMGKNMETYGFKLINVYPTLVECEMLSQSKWPRRPKDLSCSRWIFTAPTFSESSSTLQVILAISVSRLATRSNDSPSTKASSFEALQLHLKPTMKKHKYSKLKRFRNCSETFQMNFSNLKTFNKFLVDETCRGILPPSASPWPHQTVLQPSSQPPHQWAQCR